MVNYKSGILLRTFRTSKLWRSFLPEGRNARCVADGSPSSRVWSDTWGSCTCARSRLRASAARCFPRAATWSLIRARVRSAASTSRRITSWILVTETQLLLTTALRQALPYNHPRRVRKLIQMIKILDMERHGEERKPEDWAGWKRCTRSKEVESWYSNMEGVKVSNPS